MRTDAVLTVGLGLVGLIGLYCFSNKKSASNVVTRKEVDRISESEMEMTVKSCKYTDLTTAITPNTVVFPNDPLFNTKSVSAIGADCSFNLCEMRMGNHTGTHIDFPAHVITNGKSSSDYDLDDLIGEGLIIEVPSNTASITAGFVAQQKILKNDFVFFKTKNSTLSKQSSFTEKYVYIEPKAAEALLNMKVRVIGIDYISVDAYEAEHLPVHKILLSNDILIVENLELKGIEPGRCKLFVMPLHIPNMDGLPARVMMLR